jgi:hypothetical protein
MYSGIVSLEGKVRSSPNMPYNPWLLKPMASSYISKCRINGYASFEGK